MQLEHAQTILSREDVNKLKAATGEEYTKNALAIAVEFTINNYDKEKEDKKKAKKALE